MKKQKLLLMISFLAATFAFSSCQKITVENNISSPSQPVPSVSPTLTPTPEQVSTEQSSSSIKKVDFKNFKYPWVNGDYSGIKLSDPPESSSADFFELKDGEQEKNEEVDGAILQKIEYGDVTGDGEAEAIINIFPVTGGNCSCNMVYIYTIKSNNPVLLWGFGTGDRAEGGLKKASAENGKLVIETFGENNFKNGEWEFSFPKKNADAYCCPTAYTKIRFKWNGKSFKPIEKPELFDYDWEKEMNKSS